MSSGRWQVMTICIFGSVLNSMIGSVALSSGQNASGSRAPLSRNEITVSDDEVNKVLIERIRQFPGQERQVYDFYRNTPEALAELRAPIYEDKVVDYVLELAKVTDKNVSLEELYKDLDDGQSSDDKNEED